MADGNGHDSSGTLLGVNEYATFRIGGRDIKVPALTLWDLEESQEDLNTLSPTLRWSLYAKTCIRIVARKLGGEAWESMAEEMLKKCSVPEAQNMATQFSELLRVSGFNMDRNDPLPDTEETSPGTGTLTESQPDLLSPSEFPTSNTSSEP